MHNIAIVEALAYCSGRIYMYTHWRPCALQDRCIKTPLAWSYAYPPS